jgi:hypothetical protein
MVFTHSAHLWEISSAGADGDALDGFKALELVFAFDFAVTTHARLSSSSISSVNQEGRSATDT